MAKSGTEQSAVIAYAALGESNAVLHRQPYSSLESRHGVANVLSDYLTGDIDWRY